MKKRLLSAALALAMVLTLLPLSAMPASAAGEEYWGKTVAYYAAGATYPGAASGATITMAGWYYIRPATTTDPITPVQVTGGVINSTGASGTWYNNVADAMGYGASSVKLLGDVSEAVGGFAPNRNMTIDLNGHIWTTNDINIYKQVLSSSGATANNGLTKLTIQNTSTAANGTFTGGITVSPSAAAGWGYNCEIELNNVSNTNGAITMNHAGSGKVTVTNATIGDIDLVGVPAAAGGSTTGGTVTVTGSKSNTGHIKLDKFTDSTISGGKIDVNGGAKTGYLSINSTNSADIDVTNAQSTNVTIQGYNSKLDVTSGVVGVVNIFGHDSTIASNLKNSTAPTVTITGQGAQAQGIQKVGASAEALLNPYNINILYNAQVTGTIVLDNAKILVNGGKVGGKTSLKIGELTLGAANQTTMPTTMNAIELGAATVPYDLKDQNYGQVSMKVVGTNVTTGAITEVQDNNMNISVTIPADYNNKFAGVTPAPGAAKWAKGTISGGKWTTALTYSDGLLNSNLLYLLKDTRDGNYPYSYWQSSQINDLVAKYDIPTTGVDSKTTVTTTDKNDTSTGKLTLKVGDPATVPNPGTGSGETQPTGVPKTVFEVSFGPSATTFQLPSEVGGNTVKEWTSDDRSPVGGGGAVALNGAGEVTFIADSLGYQITKVNDVLIADREANPTATAAFSGNTISLSGAVWAVGNTATIDLVLKTDSGDIKVKAAWNPDTNSLTFMEGNPTLSTQTNGSMIFTDSMTAIQLTVNNTKYTLRNAGLRKEASLLEVQGNTNTNKGGMTTTVTIAENIMNKAAREKLAKDMTVLAGADGVVDFSGSPAVLERLGAALAGIDNNQVNAWLKSARQQAYRKQHNNQNPTNDTQLLTTGYNTVAAVLYMNVNITSFGSQASGGMLTATMTPYLRVEVQHDDPATWADKNPPIIVRQPASLGNLTGEVGEVEVTLPAVAGFTPAGYAAQNNTYVYPVAPANVGDPYKFTMTHAASNGAGFGTISINGTPAPISLVDDEGDAVDPVVGYNTLQAAVDDAKNGYVVKVGPSITGNQTIEMRGTARTIYVDTQGNATIKCSTSGVIVSEKVNGHNYAVQLTRDNIVVKPTEKPIPITVASVTGGSASLSASRANEGETITVTLTPSTNYRVGGVTVTAAVKNSTTGAATNTTVTTTAASTNSWRFVVPTGATSVTVTPSFTKTQTTTNPTVTVSNPNRGRGTATTSAGSNQVAPGTTVTVSTAPASGQRTMGLSVTGATAYRIGENQFTFTVPSGYATVVVTPTFDAQNGTSFSDVWSTEYFSPAVAWAVGRGITNGTSTYTFGSYNSCTREDMVTFLYRAAGSPAVGNVRNPFWDVQPGSYYYNAVMWAVSKGITNGVSSNQFGVGQNVTRAQAVTFLYRYNGSPAASTNSGFYDVPSSEYYAKAVSWANATGVTNGTSTTAFSPNQNCQRAQIVSFLYRNATGARA